MSSDVHASDARLDAAVPFRELAGELWWNRERVIAKLRVGGRRADLRVAQKHRDARGQGLWRAAAAHPQHELAIARLQAGH